MSHAEPLVAFSRLGPAGWEAVEAGKGEEHLEQGGVLEEHGDGNIQKIVCEEEGEEGGRCGW